MKKKTTISNRAHIVSACFPPKQSVHSHSRDIRVAGAENGRRHLIRAGKAVIIRTPARWMISKGGRSEAAAAGTPLLPWKFRYRDGRRRLSSDAGKEARVIYSEEFRRERGDGSRAVNFSARKLAARLWQVAADTVFDGDGRRGAMMWRSVPFHRFGPQPRSWLPLTRPETEGATKRECHEGQSENYHSYSHRELYKTRRTSALSFASGLKIELIKALNQINELEIERKMSKRKFQHFLRKLNEERSTWIRREHHKMRVLVDDMKDELRKERRSYQMMDAINSKLHSELTNAKLSNKQFMQDTENERKARILLEDLCKELAKEIEEDKVEIGALKNECSRLREEVNEERKMLQLAEVWREERVHMKLLDAKHVLEEKYFQMQELIEDLKAFLRSRDDTVDTVLGTSETAMIEEDINTTSKKFIMESLRMPTKTNDVHAIYGSPQTGKPNKKRTSHCVTSSPYSHATGVHGYSPDMFVSSQYPTNEPHIGFIDDEGICKDVSDCTETVTHIQDQSPSYTPPLSPQSVNKIIRARCIMSGKSEIDPINRGEESQISGTTEIASTSVEKKDDEGNCLLSDRSPSNADRTPIEDAVISSVQGNPHIARAMRGCIKWPKGIQRHGLKGKLLKARLESQRTQLRNVLKRRSL